ncbi:Nif3-like dinuclear metal center hexameric protein [Siphonobacter sp. SORGH_AS_1065]|uniref:Nif3-like dinuclear metal center hexameric protein n=1 Tax=Siphonobacter sp. SORGH_AS_1065 TaxID=3041795 RepID=UPI002781B59F|nr:Nif3-like dinuclear metal center hexameric protein [Siphonobacter sp. SORGH_AS_1065]MDQ1088184.1 dinuclear metal center YbgI/SA1388 family protein [Siphonobacter sp. SORGH_AS_1065]
MITIQEVTRLLELKAPLAYQESYDNAGLIVGDPRQEVQNILVSLDCTEEIVDEALEQNCNLIVAHHPIVFKGLKKFNGKNYVEKTVIKAIKHDIAIYAIHTNLDSVKGGVNWKIAEKLGLTNIQVLSPKPQTLQKLTAFVPEAYTTQVLQALYAAGAGQIGDYKNCSFRTSGTGTFLPTESAQPFIGKPGETEEVNEHRIEVIFPAHLQSSIMRALRASHPYEEVAHYLHQLENEDQTVGSGAIGELPEPLSEMDWLAYLKNKMQLNVIRHTPLRNKTVQKVAVCGGAGSFLLKDAVGHQADVFVTADFKYHEFFDAENRLIICDIGHYESEVFTKELLSEILTKNFPNFATLLSKTDTNPVHYFV